MIGELRHRVDLQTRQVISGAGGHLAETWTTLARVSAHVEPLRGTEELLALQLVQPITHKITVRYAAGHDSARRILFGPRVFAVKSVINKGERNRYLIFRAEEQT